MNTIKKSIKKKMTSLRERLVKGISTLKQLPLVDSMAKVNVANVCDLLVSIDILFLALLTKMKAQKKKSRKSLLANKVLFNQLVERNKENGKLKDRFNKLYDTLVKTNDKCRELEHELDSKNKTVIQSSSRNLSLEERLSKQHDRLVEIRKERDDFEHRLDTQHDTLVVSIEQCESLEKSLTKADANHGRLLADIEGQIDETSESLLSCSCALSDKVSHALYKIKEKLTKANDTIESLHTDVHDPAKSNVTVEAIEELLEAKEELTKANDTLFETRKERDDFEHRLAKQHDTLAESREQCAALKKSLALVKTKNGYLRADIRDQINETDKVSHDLYKTKEELTQANKTMVILRDGLCDQNNETSEFEIEELLEAKEELTEANDTLLETRKECEALKESLAKANTNHDNLRDNTLDQTSKVVFKLLGVREELVEANDIIEKGTTIINDQASKITALNISIRNLQETNDTDTDNDTDTNESPDQKVKQTRDTILSFTDVCVVRTQINDRSVLEIYPAYNIEGKPNYVVREPLVLHEEGKFLMQEETVYQDKPSNDIVELEMKETDNTKEAHDHNSNKFEPVHVLLTKAFKIKTIELSTLHRELHCDDLSLPNGYALFVPPVFNPREDNMSICYFREGARYMRISWHSAEYWDGSNESTEQG